MTVPQSLIRKWTKIFHYRDTDNDGITRESDFTRYTENFVKAYGERGFPVREVSQILWSTMTAKQYKPEVTLAEFLDNYKYLWTEDREGLREKLTRYGNLCFDAIDTDGDHFISVQEYSVYQNCFGITNQDYIKHIFDQMDTNGDGVISREEFLGEMLEYALAEGDENISDMYDHQAAKTFPEIKS